MDKARLCDHRQRHQCAGRAAMLGKGRSVLMLERNDRIGGCIRSEEITAPGYIHDVMATTFVLFITSPAYARSAGSRQAWSRILPFATSFRRALAGWPLAVVSMKRAENGAALDCARAGRRRTASRRCRDGRAERPCSSPCSAGSCGAGPPAKLLAREAWRRGRAASPHSSARR